MNKRTLIVVGIIAVAIVGVAVLKTQHFPPSGTEGTIGAAKRYESEQIAASDVSLKDPETQAFLQSDLFHKAQTDPEFRKKLSENGAVFSTPEGVAFMQALSRIYGRDADVQKAYGKAYGRDADEAQKAFGKAYGKEAADAAQKAYGKAYGKEADEAQKAFGKAYGKEAADAAQRAYGKAYGKDVVEAQKAYGKDADAAQKAYGKEYGREDASLSKMFGHDGVFGAVIDRPDGARDIETVSKIYSRMGTEPTASLQVDAQRALGKAIDPTLQNMIDKVNLAAGQDAGMFWGSLGKYIAASPDGAKLLGDDRLGAMVSDPQVMALIANDGFAKFAGNHEAFAKAFGE